MAKKLKPTYNPDEPTLDLEFQDTDVQEQSGPVTVLGMTASQTKIHFKG